jgi:uridine phosphorylase
MKHVVYTSGDVAAVALLPGDPGRARRIAERMDAADLVSENREFVLYRGRFGGQGVGICSTGIGGPSASIAMEELARGGARVFIRVGSAGGRQPDIPIGTPIILTASHRADGTSAQYLPLGFPAVADFAVTRALVDAAAALPVACRIGIGYTRDAYYARDAVLDERLRSAGVLAAEQEASTLFVAGSSLGVRVGAIVTTDSNIWREDGPDPEAARSLYEEGERAMISVALEAARALSAMETAAG